MSNQDIFETLCKTKDILNNLIKDIDSCFDNFDPEFKDILSKDIDFLDLSQKAYALLKSSNINTIYDLLQKFELQIISISGLGQSTYLDIVSSLSRHGLKLRKSKLRPDQLRLVRGY